jgi:hypothetical protein
MALAAMLVAHGLHETCMVQPMLVPCYHLAMAGLFLFSRADMRRLAAVGGGGTLGTRGRGEVRGHRR